MQQALWISRPAFSFEWSVALSFMPELLASDRLPDTIFVVTPVSEPNHIVAVAVAIPEIKHATHPGFPVFVRVLPSYRLRGIGRLLLNTVASYVQSWDVPYMLSFQAYAEGDEQSFLTACGFVSTLKVHHFQVLRNSAHRLLNTMRRYQQSRESQQRFTIQPITEQNYKDIIPLYCMHFTMSYDVGEAKVRQLMQSPMFTQLSAVAYQQGNAVAFILGQLDQQGLPKVNFWMTKQEFRNSALSLQLLCVFVQNAYDNGFDAARFDGNDDAHATLKIAQRLQAETIGVYHSYARPVLI